MKITSSVTTDLTALKRLQRQLNNTVVSVGYIDSPKHWMSDMPVAQVAKHLHYWSPWADTFMLSDTKKSQVQSVVDHELSKLGQVDFSLIAGAIGKGLKSKIADNIIAVDSPQNSKEWAAVKTFNDPLRFGSKVGQSPNLISEITFKVGAT